MRWSIWMAMMAIASDAAAEPAFTSGTSAGVVCACDVRMLRPLQGAIGMDEVMDKADKIEAKPARAWEDLEADSIRLVRGPDHTLFITDHRLHQDRAGPPRGRRRQAADPAQLPLSLEQMPDDLYRSLAWRLRKAGGFCRAEMAQKEFVEFIRADWLRTRLELPADAVRGSTSPCCPRRWRSR